MYIKNMGPFILKKGFLGSSYDKESACNQETQVQSLGWEDALEKGMAIHSTILPRVFHRQTSLASYSPWGCKESETTD